MNVCRNCGSPLNGSAFCARCGTKAEVNQAPVYNNPNASQPQNQQNQYGGQQAWANYQQPQQPMQPQQPQQPSAAGEAFKNAFVCFKGLFSKNPVEELSVYNKGKANIWIILTSLTALISAIACCIHYVSPATEVVYLANLFSMPVFSGRISSFFAGFFLMAILEFSFIAVIFLYGKLIKKRKISFFRSANIVSTSFLPMTLATAMYMLIGRFAGIVFTMAFLIFAYLLLKALEEEFEEKMFWSFFIIFAVAFATTLIFALGITLPKLLMNEIQDSYTYSRIDNIFGRYYW